MYHNGIISARQFAIIVLLFVVGDSILYVPSLTAAEAKQDAWISGIIGWGEGLLLTLLYSAVGKRYPNQTIIQYSELILGRWLGKVVSVLFITYFFIDASLMLMEIGDFVTTQIMPETPIEIILVLFAWIIIMAVRVGVDPFARIAELLFLWFLLLFIILIVFSLPEVNVTNLQPVLAQGMGPVWGGNFRLFGYLLESVILMVFFPLVNSPKSAASAYLWGMFGANVILTVMIAVSLLAIGPNMTELLAYPSYALAQKISVARFFERIEVIMAVIWFITLFIKISVCYYATSVGIAQVLGMKGYRSLTLPLGMIMIILALTSMPNRPYFDAFVSLIWMPYSLTYGLFIPLLLLVVHVLRGKWDNRQAK